jgi:hypothetical protein
MVFNRIEPMVGPTMSNEYGYGEQTKAVKVSVIKDELGEQINKLEQLEKALAHLHEVLKPVMRDVPLDKPLKPDTPERIISQVGQALVNNNVRLNMIIRQVEFLAEMVDL